MNGFLHSWLGPGAIQGINFVAIILLLLVCTVFGVAAFFVWLSKRHTLGRRRLPKAEAPAFSWLGNQGYHPGMLDFPCRWLAIRSDDPHAVQSALNLVNPTLCSWEEGLAEARERKLFISPPVDEWILVVGSGLPEPGDDVDQCFRFLTSLSRKLGHVQYFSADRVLQHHAWVQLCDGAVERAYAWAGQTLWNQGRMTPAEMQLRLRCLDYCEGLPRSIFDQSEVFAANTEKVPLLAAKWSVDPTSIEEKHFKASHGIAGELSSKSY
jgi:hypothetical protein